MPFGIPSTAFCIAWRPVKKMMTSPVDSTKKVFLTLIFLNNFLFLNNHNAKKRKGIVRFHFHDLFSMWLHKTFGTKDLWRVADKWMDKYLISKSSHFHATLYTQNVPLSSTWEQPWFFGIYSPFTPITKNSSSLIYIDKTVFSQYSRTYK